MDVEKKTIQDWRKEYLNDFLPSKKKMLEQINTQDRKIMTGLVTAIREAIPAGKWKVFFEKHIDYSLPWKKSGNKNESPKGSLYRMLYDRMPCGAGICFFGVNKEDVLEAGFNSWEDFIKSLKELNDALGDICVFRHLKLSEEVSVDTTHIQLMFETTLR